MSKTVLQRHLFGPGPCNPYPEATAALGLPLLGHLDPEFIARMDRSIVSASEPMRLVPPLTPTRASGVGAASGVAAVGSVSSGRGGAEHPLSTATTTRTDAIRTVAT